MGCWKELGVCVQVFLGTVQGKRLFWVGQLSGIKDKIMVGYLSNFYLGNWKNQIIKNYIAKESVINNTTQGMEYLANLASQT